MLSFVKTTRNLSFGQHFYDLVDLHRRVNEPREPEASVEANRASQHEESIGTDQHIPKIEKTGHRFGDVEPCEEVESCIKEKVECRRTCSKIRPPPPQVVLTAQLEIAKHHRNLSTSHDQYNQHEEQEPENVVELMQPD